VKKKRETRAITAAMRAAARKHGSNQSGKPFGSSEPLLVSASLRATAGSDWILTTLPFASRSPLLHQWIEGHDHRGKRCATISFGDRLREQLALNVVRQKYCQVLLISLVIENTNMHNSLNNA
jgi:hypothetical protein